jgi:hypothetical protein
MNHINHIIFGRDNEGMTTTDQTQLWLRSVNGHQITGKPDHIASSEAEWDTEPVAQSLGYQLLLGERLHCPCHNQGSLAPL